MILSDKSIKDFINSGEIIIETELSKSDLFQNIACASLDLRLGNWFKKFPKNDNIFNPFENEGIKLEEIFIEDGDYIVLQPGDFLLWITKEKIWISERLVARVEWRSSIWRLGILIHSTAWFIDPGFGYHCPSTITLEIKNINTVPVALKIWHRVCQIAFHLMDNPAEIPYYSKKSAKYNWQQKPQESKISKDPTLNC